MATNKDDVDVPDYDADVNEFDQTQRASAENKQSKPKSSGGTSGESSRSRKGRSSRRPSQSKKDEDQSEQVSDEDETKREPFTATLERGHRSRMNGMVHHAQTVGEPQNVASISDYVNLAIGEKLARDEKRLNNGKRFPEPVHMRTGRPQKRR